MLLEAARQRRRRAPGQARRSLDVGEEERDRARRQQPCRLVARPGRRTGQWCWSVRRAAGRRPRRIAIASVGCSSERSKSHDAMARQLVGSAVTTVATRGCRSRSDSSPKKSPGPSRAISRRRGDPDAALDDDEEPRPDLALARDHGRPGTRPRPPGRRSRTGRRRRGRWNSGQPSSSSTPRRGERHAASWAVQSSCCASRASASTAADASRTRPVIAEAGARRMPERARATTRHVGPGMAPSDGQPGRDRRRARGDGDVRRPDDAPAQGRRPHLRRGWFPAGRADPPPGPPGGAST